jgi:hypothetical protein
MRLFIVGGNKLNVCSPRPIAHDDEGNTIFRKLKHDPTTRRHIPEDSVYINTAVRTSIITKYMQIMFRKLSFPSEYHLQG